MNVLLVEAISSVAASHRGGCDCTVCRAACGDRQAYLAVVSAVLLGADLSPRKP